MNASDILRQLHGKALPYNQKDPGNTLELAPVRQFCAFPIQTGASDQTRTLADPTYANQRVMIYMLQDGGGDCAITADSAIDELGTTVFTLKNAAGFINLIGVVDSYTAGETNYTYAWRIENMGDVELTSLVTAGDGFGDAELYKPSVQNLGNGLIKTEILIDVTGTDEGGTDLDIMGDDAEANAHIGQITAAVNGTLVAGKMTCLEAPGTAQADIDLYYGDAGTGVQDANIDTADSGSATAMITSAAAWTAGRSLGMVALPPANEYMYLCTGGTGGTDTYTAGKFLIELWGTA